MPANMFTLERNSDIALASLNSAVGSGSEKRVLVGHSLGCASVMMAVADSPGAVAAVVLQDPVVLPFLGGQVSDVEVSGLVEASGTIEESAAMPQEAFVVFQGSRWVGIANILLLGPFWGCARAPTCVGKLTMFPVALRVWS